MEWCNCSTCDPVACVGGALQTLAMTPSSARASFRLEPSEAGLLAPTVLLELSAMQLLWCKVLSVVRG
jgi:hypothetical protein